MKSEQELKILELLGDNHLKPISFGCSGIDHRFTITGVYTYNGDVCVLTDNDCCDMDYDELEDDEKEELYNKLF